METLKPTKDLPNATETKAKRELAKNVNTAITVAQNCPCGELVEDCPYPKCGLGGETLPEPEAKKTYCKGCKTESDCDRYGCQHGD